MDINKIWRLVTGDNDETEKQSILADIEKDKEALHAYHELKNTWAILSSTKPMSESEIDNMYLRFRQQVSAQSSPLRIRFNELYKYAAIFLLGVLITSLSMYWSGNSGWFGSDKSLIHTVVADKGQISKVILPDSSVVWINSGSKIAYNNKFGVNNREIELVGQAFFHAARDKKLPLIVGANNLKIKVLGTKFDVCAYPGEKDIRVVLESGRIELNQASDKKFSYRLSPGEVAIFNPVNKSLVINKVQPELFSSWKEGVLIFRDEPMTEVIAALQRRYNIDIEVNDTRIYNSVFTARISNEPLDKILKSMEFSCSLKATIVRNSAKTDSSIKVILSKQ